MDIFSFVRGGKLLCNQSQVRSLSPWVTRQLAVVIMEIQWMGMQVAEDVGIANQRAEIQGSKKLEATTMSETNLHDALMLPDQILVFAVEVVEDMAILLNQVTLGGVLLLVLLAEGQVVLRIRMTLMDPSGLIPKVLHVPVRSVTCCRRSGRIRTGLSLHWVRFALKILLEKGANIVDGVVL